MAVFHEIEQYLEKRHKTKKGECRHSPSKYLSKATYLRPF